VNYRHIFHAGNFADAFKHIVLIALIESLKNKDAPFCYLDTHAGCAQYDLDSESAKKTHEYRTGVGRIFKQKNFPRLVQTYVDCIREINPDDTLHFYPGSPHFVRQLLRPQDHMILSELHATDFKTLKKHYHEDKQVATHHQDGWLSLKAFLPPKERRGLVLIDPPYEDPTEFFSVAEKIQPALKRFETGVFALWYPMKSNIARNPFYRDVKKLITRPTLFVEISFWPEDGGASLHGSGMLIINPPWTLDTTLREILPWLWQTLSPHRQGEWKIF